ncbi:hypothetical protein WEI85_29070 [Actinomycetes bacterium KLBMP 9797]
MLRKPSFAHLSGIAAIGFAAMIVTGNLIALPAGLPHSGAALSDVTAFFRGHGDILGVSAALGPATWVLATLFGAGAVLALWPAERERGEAWSLVGFGGLLLQNATFTAIVATRLALAAPSAGDATATGALWALHDGLFVLNGTFLALALTGLSVAGRRGGLTPRWHYVLGLVAAVLQFGAATLAPLAIDDPGRFGFLGLLGWLLWVVWLVAYGIRLVRHDQGVPQVALTTTGTP